MPQANKDPQVQIPKSRECWREVIAHYSTSGLPQKKFCAENGIPFGPFRNWLYRLRLQDQAEAEGKKPLFVPIVVKEEEVTPASSAPPLIELSRSTESPLILELADNTRIIVSPGFGSETLCRLLDVLGRRTC